MEKTKRVVTIDCMDYRRNDDADRTENRVSIRTGGAMLGAVKRQIPALIEYYGAKEGIKIQPHEDCGAIGVIVKGIKNRSSIHPSMWNAYVPPILKHVSEPDAHKVQSAAGFIQYNIACSLVEKPEAVSWKIEKNSDKILGEETLLLMPPTVEKFSEILEALNLTPKTYVLTVIPNKLQRTAVDVNVAVREIGVKRIVGLEGKDDAGKSIAHLCRALMRGELEVPALRYGIDLRKNPT